MNFKIKKLQFAAWVTLFAFSVTNTGWSAPVSLALPTEKFSSAVIPERIEVPADLGTVESQYRASGNAPFILVLQDAHAILDAQLQTQKLLGYFQKKYGIDLVALEGGQGPVDATLFRTFPDELAKKKVMGDYLEKAEITGAQMAAVFGEHEGRYYGIEDWGLYEENYLAYARAAEKKTRVLGKIQELQNRLDEKRKRLFSPELNQLHERAEAFREEKINLIEFLKYLSASIKTRHPERPSARAAKRPSEGSESEILRHKTPQDDTKWLELYPPPHHLTALMNSLAKEESFKKEDLAVSLRKMAEAFRKKAHGRMGKKQEMEFNERFRAFQSGESDSGSFLKFLVEIGASLGFKPRLTLPLQALLGNVQTLSAIKGSRLFEELENFTGERKNTLARNPEEKELVEKYRKLVLLRNLASLELTHDQLREYQKDPHAHLEMTENADLLTPALEFYRLALERDKSFRRNLKKLLKKQKSKTAIMIAGGFHTRGFEENLKADGYSYAVIMPKIGSLDGKDRYAGLMQGNLSYKNYLKTTFYDAFTRASTVKLVGELSAPDFRRSLKVWRDEVLRKLAKEGRIADAGRYTDYIDLLFKVYYDKFGEEKGGLSKEEILKAVEEELQKFRQRKVGELWRNFESQLDIFTQGLKTLIDQKELNLQNVSSLIDRAGQSGLSGTIHPSVVNMMPQNRPPDQRLLDWIFAGKVPQDIRSEARSLESRRLDRSGWNPGEEVEEASVKPPTLSDTGAETNPDIAAQQTPPMEEEKEEDFERNLRDFRSVFAVIYDKTPPAWLRSGFEELEGYFANRQTADEDKDFFIAFIEKARKVYALDSADKKELDKNKAAWQKMLKVLFHYYPLGHASENFGRILKKLVEKTEFNAAAWNRAVAESLLEEAAEKPEYQKEAAIILEYVQGKRITPENNRRVGLKNPAVILKWLGKKELQWIHLSKEQEKGDTAEKLLKLRQAKLASIRKTLDIKAEKFPPRVVPPKTTPRNIDAWIESALTVGDKFQKVFKELAEKASQGIFLGFGKQPAYPEVKAAVEFLKTNFLAKDSPAWSEKDRLKELIEKLKAVQDAQNLHRDVPPEGGIAYSPEDRKAHKNQYEALRAARNAFRGVLRVLEAPASRSEARTSEDENTRSWLSPFLVQMKTGGEGLASTVRRGGNAQEIPRNPEMDKAAGSMIKAYLKTVFPNKKDLQGIEIEALGEGAHFRVYEVTRRDANGKIRIYWDVFKMNKPMINQFTYEGAPDLKQPDEFLQHLGDQVLETKNVTAEIPEANRVPGYMLILQRRGQPADVLFTKVMAEKTEEGRKKAEHIFHDVLKLYENLLTQKAVFVVDANFENALQEKTELPEPAMKLSDFELAIRLDPQAVYHSDFGKHKPGNLFENPGNALSFFGILRQPIFDYYGDPDSERQETAKYFLEALNRWAEEDQKTDQSRITLPIFFQSLLRKEKFMKVMKEYFGPLSAAENEQLEQGAVTLAKLQKERVKKAWGELEDPIKMEIFNGILNLIELAVNPAEEAKVSQEETPPVILDEKGKQKENLEDLANDFTVWSQSLERENKDGITQEHRSMIELLGEALIALNNENFSEAARRLDEFVTQASEIESFRVPELYMSDAEREAKAIRKLAEKFEHPPASPDSSRPEAHAHGESPLAGEIREYSKSTRSEDASKGIDAQLQLIQDFSNFALQDLLIFAAYVQSQNRDVSGDWKSQDMQALFERITNAVRGFRWQDVLRESKNLQDESNLRMGNVVRQWIESFYLETVLKKSSGILYPALPGFEPKRVNVRANNRGKGVGNLGAMAQIAKGLASRWPDAEIRVYAAEYDAGFFKKALPAGTRIIFDGQGEPQPADVSVFVGNLFDRFSSIDKQNVLQWPETRAGKLSPVNFFFPVLAESGEKPEGMTLDGKILNYIPLSMEAGKGAIYTDQELAEKSESYHQMPAAQLNQKRSELLEAIMPADSPARRALAGAIPSAHWASAYYQNAGTFLNYAQAIRDSLQPGERVDLYAVPGEINTPEVETWLQQGLKEMGIGFYDIRETEAKEFTQDIGLRVIFLPVQPPDRFAGMILLSGKIENQGLSQRFPNLATGDISWFQNILSGKVSVHDLYSAGLGVREGDATGRFAERYAGETGETGAERGRILFGLRRRIANDLQTALAGNEAFLKLDKAQQTMVLSGKSVLSQEIIRQKLLSAGYAKAVQELIAGNEQKIFQKISKDIFRQNNATDLIAAAFDPNRASSPYAAFFPHSEAQPAARSESRTPAEGRKPLKMFEKEIEREGGLNFSIRSMMDAKEIMNEIQKSAEGTVNLADIRDILGRRGVERRNESDAVLGFVIQRVLAEISGTETKETFAENIFSNKGRDRLRSLIYDVLKDNPVRKNIPSDITLADSMIGVIRTVTAKGLVLGAGMAGQGVSAETLDISALTPAAKALLQDHEALQAAYAQFAKINFKFSDSVILGTAFLKNRNLKEAQKNLREIMAGGRDLILAYDSEMPQEVQLSRDLVKLALGTSAVAYNAARPLSAAKIHRAGDIFGLLLPTALVTKGTDEKLVYANEGPVKQLSDALGGMQSTLDAVELLLNRNILSLDKQGRRILDQTALNALIQVINQLAETRRVIQQAA